MNIFVVDKDPIISAQMLCDKHVVKMVTEQVQTMSTVFPKEIAPYKHTHYNHPVCIWARQSLGNFEWLLLHSLALSDEYTRRYGKTHACLKYINWCFDNYNKLNFPETKLTQFAQCFGDYKEQCFTPNDPISGYRKYYIIAKSKFAKWKLGNIPEWYSVGIKELNP